MPAFRLLRPVLRLMTGSSAARSETTPLPHDEPAVRTGDPLADRLLLVGNGTCVGWGVATHQLALPGALSRALTARLDASVDVDFVGGSIMGVEDAEAWVGDRARRGYRAALVVIGATDAIALVTPTQWRQSLGRLLDRLDADLPPAAPLFVTTLPGIDLGGTAMGQAATRIVTGRASGLDAITRDLVARIDRAVLLDDAGCAYRPASTVSAADDYRAHGERLAAAMEDTLRASPRQPVTSLRPPTRWAAAGLARASAESADALAAMMRSACEEFAVHGACLTILDGENAWIAASALAAPSWLPRHLTYCDTTATNADVLIVSDSRKDERFRDNPLNRDFLTRFYAGHPIRDLGGDRIGAVCLVDTRPRAMSSLDVDRLRTLARRVEVHLHALERTLAFVP